MSRLRRRLNILRWAEWGGAVLAIVVASVVVFGQQRHRRHVANAAREQNRLKMDATREDIEQYIDRIRMDLRMIALDNDVVAMTRDSRDYIKAIYEEHYQQYRLSEVYVIERGFDGTQAPFMAFEHGDEENDVDELHSTVQEEAEYRVQIAQMRRFAQDRTLEVLISQPVQLCMNEPGLVVSVPIRSKGVLVGMVAGMIPTNNISAVLERGQYNNVALLVNDRGTLFPSEDFPAETLRWFEEQFRQCDETTFFATRDETFDVGRYASLWTPVDLPGGPKWYLAFMYDKATYLDNGGAAGTLAGWASAGIVLLLGGAVLLLCRTLRQRFHAEDEARQANAMLVDALETEKRLSNQLELAREQADAANAIKSEFLANMSHEIRTPMGAILGFAENLLDGDQPESQRLNCVHTIRRNGEHLLGLINDILDLSKIEAGKMTIEQVACHPCQIIADVASLMRVRADAKGLPFTFEYTGAMPQTIQCDPTRLRQILINLAGNAVKFTEQGCVRLVIELIEQAGEAYLQFDVVDTGVGLTDAQVGKLFGAFAQADTATTRKFGGTGLGLAISKRLAELLGGDVIVAATEAGVGSTFRATVATGSLDGVTMLDDPLSATVVEKDANAAAPDIPIALGGLRILLAEDGLDNQRLISFVLTKAGAVVTVVNNGKLALDAALAARDEDRPFDVILMDMQMPVMDGYEATGQLRLQGYGAPIIALTAHAMAGDREKCIKAGCNDYTTKPIDRVQLIKLVNALAGTPNSVPPPPQAAPPEGQTLLAGCHILEVDDCLANQRLIALVLEKAGATVSIKEDGKLAVEAARAAREAGRPFDIILMDMQMPVMDGYEATRRLRRDGFVTPIIAVTAHALAGDKEKCLLAGCDDFHAKPIDRLKLIEMIRHYWSGKPALSATTS